MLLINLICHAPIVIRDQHVNWSPFSQCNVRSNRHWHVWSVISEQVLSGFYESHKPPTTSGDAHGIEPPHHDGSWNGHQSGYILHLCFVCCRPGGRRGDMEQVVAQWGDPVASGVALDMLHWTMLHILLQCLRMPSKWPATEVHLFVTATFFSWHNHS